MKTQIDLEQGNAALSTTELELIKGIDACAGDPADDDDEGEDDEDDED